MYFCLSTVKSPRTLSFFPSTPSPPPPIQESFPASQSLPNNLRKIYNRKEAQAPPNHKKPQAPTPPTSTAPKTPSGFRLLLAADFEDEGFAADEEVDDGLVAWFTPVPVAVFVAVLVLVGPEGLVDTGTGEGMS